MVANHRSNFDPFIAIAACPQVDLAYIAKPEIFNIPIVGRIVHQCFFLPINRTDNREALGTIKYAAKLLFRDITEIDDHGAFFRSLQDGDRVVIAGGDGTLNRFINDTAPLQIDCIITYSFLTCETAALPQTPTQTRKGFG